MQTSDNLSQFLIIKDIYRKLLINSNGVFKRNSRCVSHYDFKNKIKNIPLDNILSPDDIIASFVIIFFFFKNNYTVT